MIYKDNSYTIHERVMDLLSQMTIKEKVGQVNQHLYGWKVYQKKDNGQIELTEYFKKHVEWGGGLGALYGLFRADPWSQVTTENGISPQESIQVRNMVQEYVKKHSRFQIPALFVEECPHGHQGLDSVSYPTNIGRGNMFNVPLVEKMSKAMAEELVAKGVHLALVSTLDLARDPRWGRNEECFGEDPFLAREYTKAIVRGFQGELLANTKDFTKLTVNEANKYNHPIGVVLKHFIAQGDALGGHNSGDVSIGRRELFDIYHSVMSGVENAVGVMAAYNDIDGVPCHANHKLLKGSLRKEIGFQGLVMADGGALDRLQSYPDDPASKAKLALEAGVDLSLWDKAYLNIQFGIKSGKIKEEDLDKAVYHVLSIKFLLGLFDEESNDVEINWHNKKDEWQNINLETARESITLLKNKKRYLPIKEPKKIAVIGPNAHALYNQLGDYTSPQTFTHSTTLLEGVQKKFPSSEILYHEGCKVRSRGGKIDQAVEIAKKADVIILALGGSSARNFDTEFLDNGAVSVAEENMDSGENIDVAELHLGGDQLVLLDLLSKLEKPIISILIQGRPYELNEVIEKSQAVLVAWFPGQRGGEAIAEVLCGETNPNGRLSQSIPYTSGQLPVYYNQKFSMKKEEYFDKDGKPQFSFGYGLSYSTICYSKLECDRGKISVDELKSGARINLSLQIENKGPFDAKESVLLFTRKIGTPLLSRNKELKSMKKIELKNGERSIVTFNLGYKDFVQLDYEYMQTVYPCLVEVYCGSQSIKIELLGEEE